MNAKVSELLNPTPGPHSQAAAHYSAVEDHARDVDKARVVIHDLRMELHSVIANLQGLASQIHAEVNEHQALINRAKATLLRTLPGGELDELDAKSKPARRDELFETIANICLPPVHRASCDCCNERPWTHRRDAFGIETYVCDVCGP